MKGRSLYVERLTSDFFAFGALPKFDACQQNVVYRLQTFLCIEYKVLALWTERGLYRDCHQGMTKGFVYMCDGEKNIL